MCLRLWQLRLKIRRPLLMSRASHVLFVFGQTSVSVTAHWCDPRIGAVEVLLRELMPSRAEFGASFTPVSAAR